MKTLTCAIIGTGPLGLALGQRLRKAGVKIGFFGRGGPFALDRVVDGERLRLPAAELRDLALVLSAVPAHAVAQAFVDHASHFAPGTPWINLSNGMVWDELLSLGQRFPNVIPRAGIVQFGAREEDHRIVTVGATDVRWGPVDQTPMHPAEKALARIEGWFWDEGIKARLVLKWIYNSVLNSLCAANGWRSNSEALQHWALVSNLTTEAVALAAELWGITLDDAATLAGLEALVKKTAANKNSMVRALERGKTTEHAVLLGWIHRSQGAYPQLRALASNLERVLAAHF